MAAEKSNTRLIKLFKEDGKSYFETSSNWISSETDTFIRVDLTFVDVDKYRGFTATIDQDMLQKMKKEARVEDIDDWAKLAFSTSSQDFSFALDEEKKVLVWKKGGSKLKIRLGFIPVKSMQAAEALHTIFNQVVEITTQKDGLLQAAKKENCELMQNLKASRRKLEELKEDKEKMEQHLFGQFLPILNAKQDKIRHLMKEIENLEKKSEHSDSDIDKNKMDFSHRHSISSSDCEELLDDKDDFNESFAPDDGANRSIDSQNFLNL